MGTVSTFQPAALKRHCRQEHAESLRPQSGQRSFRPLIHPSMDQRRLQSGQTASQYLRARHPSTFGVAIATIARIVERPGPMRSRSQTGTTSTVRNTGVSTSPQIDMRRHTRREGVFPFSSRRESERNSRHAIAAHARNVDMHGRHQSRQAATFLVG